MYKEGLSIHKNGFAIIFANLSFVPIVVLFVATNAGFWGDKSTFVSFITLTSLQSTEKVTESFEGLGLDYINGLWSWCRHNWSW